MVFFGIALNGFACTPPIYHEMQIERKANFNAKGITYVMVDKLPNKAAFLEKRWADQLPHFITEVFTPSISQR